MRATDPASESPAPSSSSSSSFETFVGEVEPRLRRALVATYGPVAGRDATVDALAWAWEHRDRLPSLDNPGGYLYRVGQTAARRSARRPTIELRLVDSDAPATGDRLVEPEPALDAGLRRLTDQQRAVVVLIHGFGWSQRETAEMLGLSASTVRNHEARAMRKLKRDLGVTAPDSPASYEGGT